jgi:hypothetical protein
MRFVRRTLYVLHKDDVLVTLIGSYYADREIELTEKPDAAALETPVQHVDVSARRADDREVEEAVKAFGLSCDGQ